MKSNSYEPDALSGKVVLITGAGSGLGAALAAAFSQLGAELILLGRDKKKLSETSDTIVSAGAPAPLLLSYDFAQLNQSSANNLAHAVAEHVEKIDIIIHAAAHVGSLTPIGHYPEQQWHRVMQINCHAPMMLTQAILPLLKRPDESTCLFINDEHAIHAHPYWGAYAAAKMALSTVFKMWAEELADNTGINFIEFTPGPMQTALRANAYPGDPSGKNPLPEAYVSAILAEILHR